MSYKVDPSLQYDYEDTRRFISQQYLEHQAIERSEYERNRAEDPSS